MTPPPESGTAPASGPAAPTRRELMLAMAGVAATVILVAFDSTIVSTILPNVAQALDGMALYAWVGTGYLLSTAASILIFGRLGDMYGRKPWMLASVIIVSAGSLLCGLAQTMEQLIAFRVLQGVGGGMMIATAFAAPADLFPDPHQRVRWMAMVSATFAVASGLGPILGGAITQALGWRAAFFVTPVAGALSLALLSVFFPRIRPQHDGRRRVDWVGALLLVVAVAAPLAALELAFAPGGGAEPGLALLLAAVGVGAIALLVPVERRATWPIFPMRILSSPQSQLINVIAVAVGGVMFILIFYIPLLLQHELRYSPSQAGLLMTPLVAAIPVGSIVNGYLFPRQNEPQRLLVFGGGLMAVGCAMVLVFSEDTAAWWILLSLFVNGTALGFLLPNLTLFMQMLAERRDVGVASALVQTTRAVGSAVGTACVGIAVANVSVRTGVRIGIVLCIALAVGCAILSARIKMKNAAA